MRVAPDRLAETHQRLQAAVTELTSSAGWQRMLAVAARFPRYSPNNILLIGAQRPDATMVAGFRQWQALRRTVRRGEHGIAILAPVSYRTTRPGAEASAAPDDRGEPPARVLRGFRVVHVFDVTQTDGEPLPQIRPALLGGDAPAGLWAALAAQVAAAGFRLVREPTAPANGYTDYTSRRVAVDPRLPGRQAAKTLAHELAHALLHGPAQRADGLTREQAEVEAESVAYVVTAAAGLDAAAYTVPYVAGWAGGRPDALAGSAARVLGCARGIVTALTLPAGRPAEPDAGLGLARPAARLREVG